MGASAVKINLNTREMKAGEIVVKEGEWISVDGTTGQVFIGKIAAIAPTLEEQTERRAHIALGGFAQVRRDGVGRLGRQDAQLELITDLEEFVGSPVGCLAHEGLALVWFVISAAQVAVHAKAVKPNQPANRPTRSLPGSCGSPLAAKARSA